MSIDIWKMYKKMTQRTGILVSTAIERMNRKTGAGSMGFCLDGASEICLSYVKQDLRIFDLSFQWLYVLASGGKDRTLLFSY
jgi:hypothetical protein